MRGVNPCSFEYSKIVSPAANTTGEKPGASGEHSCQASVTGRLDCQMFVSTPLRSRLLQLTPQLTPAILRRLRLLLRLGTNLGGIIRLAYCGGARGPVILPVFKAGDPSLRGVDGGFDSHTLPPNF